ncbi:transposase [Streptomyces sp. b94]|nr:transposase [Streptomyces sp. b94]
MVADKGYSARTFRAYLRRRGIKATIPDTRRSTRRQQTAPRTALRLRKARLPAPQVVERCFHRLKQWRGIATRYDKHPDRYLAAITLASTLILPGAMRRPRGRISLKRTGPK